jgi:hypothetical protein
MGRSAGLAILAASVLLHAGAAEALSKCDKYLNRPVIFPGWYQPVPLGMAYNRDNSAEFLLKTDCEGEPVSIDVLAPAGGMPICRLTGKVLVQGVLIASGAGGFGDFAIRDPVLVQCR